jgi:hypothetical protein
MFWQLLWHLAQNLRLQHPALQVQLMPLLLADSCQQAL